MSTSPDCLIAIPCFRETERLPPFLTSLCQALQAAPFRARVVIVDDGSGSPEDADTRAFIARARGDWPEQLAEPVFLPENRGKGGAVYAGWASREASGAQLLCFVDADGSVSAQETVRLIGELLSPANAHWGALYGSRAKLLGAKVERVASRHYIGRVFATLVTLFTGLEIYDSQCGLKVIRREAYEAIAAGLRETRWVFDVELTLHLLRHGVPIREVPIDWTEVPGSKVSVVRDSLRMAVGLGRIRQRMRSLS